MEINNDVLEKYKSDISKIKFFEQTIPFTDDYIVISDFSKAVYYALEKSDYEGEYGSTWTDIREEFEGIYPKVLYQQDNWIELKAKLREIDIDKLLFNNYFTEEANEVYNEIMYDLGLCIKAKLVADIDFINKMFFAYLHGAWPCGWDGVYPDGKMIIYVPKNK